MQNSLSFRYRVVIEYDGSHYSGWQNQKNARSIQAIIQHAIQKLTLEREVKIHSAGRTDNGVHALAQVAHFDLLKQWSPFQLISGINNFLKNEEILIVDCAHVKHDFHARFSAISRHYIYRIITGKKRGVIDKNRAWYIDEDLDLGAMSSAVQFFIGTHDFTSFRSTKCQAKSATRTIDEMRVYEVQNELLLPINCTKEIRVYVRARSFLHNQVRIMVGQLRDVGIGMSNSTAVKNILEARDRKRASITAPAGGLYFYGAQYK